MKPDPTSALLRAYWRTLYRAYGRPHWWPARSRFEVIVGAYLVQNTAWTNVERALRRLRQQGLLNLAGIRRTPLPQLEGLIRPAGHFRRKARSLKAFVAFVEAQYGASLTRMFGQPTPKLREELLQLNGVGPETADSILLYAGQHPVFVVDAYSRRVLERHQILPAIAKYEETRRLFEQALGSAKPGKLRNGKPRSESFGHPPSPMSRARRSAEAQIYNDMHGLLVIVGKKYCLKSQPHCRECPLRPFLPPSGAF